MRGLRVALVSGLMAYQMPYSKRCHRTIVFQCRFVLFSKNRKNSKSGNFPNIGELTEGKISGTFCSPILGIFSIGLALLRAKHPPQYVSLNVYGLSSPSKPVTSPDLARKHTLGNLLLSSSLVAALNMGGASEQKYSICMPCKPITPQGHIYHR